MTTIFISYSHVDQDIAGKVYFALQERGVRIWIDHESLPPGTPNWNRAIRSGIESADAILYIASPDAEKSDYVQGELAVAHELKKPIVPFWVTGNTWHTVAPLNMVNAQYIDARGIQFEASLQQLYKILEISNRNELPSIPSSSPGAIGMPSALSSQSSTVYPLSDNLITSRHSSMIIPAWNGNKVLITIAIAVMTIFFGSTSTVISTTFVSFGTLSELNSDIGLITGTAFVLFSSFWFSGLRLSYVSFRRTLVETIIGNIVMVFVLTFFDFFIIASNLGYSLMSGIGGALLLKFLLWGTFSSSVGGLLGTAFASQLVEWNKVRPQVKRFSTVIIDSLTVWGTIAIYLAFSTITVILGNAAYAKDSNYGATTPESPIYNLLTLLILIVMPGGFITMLIVAPSQIARRLQGIMVTPKASI